jgi:hypothetical protein
VKFRDTFLRPHARREGAEHRPIPPCAVLAAIVVGVGAGACADPEPRTQVMVVVDADPVVRLETERIRITVRGGRGESMGGLDRREDREFLRDALGEAALEWPTLIAIVPLDGDAGRIFEVEVEAIDATRRAVALVRARTGFSPGRTLTLRLRLEDACRGVFCRAGLTCERGQCVDANVPVATLPPFDPRLPEEDAGAPTPRTCTRDAECDDGVPCNGDERCVDGECVPGTPLVCDDRVACTRDVCTGRSCVAEPDDGACTAAPGGQCDPVNGCQYPVCNETTCAADPTACETARCEGTTCVRTTTCAPGETCCAGACVPRGCDDGNECTIDSCGLDGCVHAPRTDASCSDGNACTVMDRCTADGTCRGMPRECDDRNPCTDDGCDPRTGCTSVPNTRPCDDGNPCTTGDRCSEGECRSGAPCNDGVACTVDTCGGAGCVFTPMNSLCTAAPGGTCHATWGCQYPSCSPATCADTPCETAACEGTTCVRRPRVCADDGNPCTAEVCDAMVGCRSMPNVGAVCNDGDVCTENDRCTAAGMCMGTRRSCDDGNPCTTDTCDSAAGCVNTPRNGERCGGDECVPRYCDRFGSCIPRPVSCFDDNMFDCKHKECMDGVCVDVAAPAHTPCVEGMCSGECDGTSLMRCVVPPSGGGDQCL